MLKVSNALILDFFTALSLLNVPLQKIEATPKICDTYRTGNEKELRYPNLHCRRFQLLVRPKYAYTAGWSYARLALNYFQVM